MIKKRETIDYFKNTFKFYLPKYITLEFYIPQFTYNSRTTMISARTMIIWQNRKPYGKTGYVWNKAFALFILGFGFGVAHKHQDHPAMKNYDYEGDLND